MYGRFTEARALAAMPDECSREEVMDHESRLKQLAVLYWLGREDSVVAWAGEEYSTNWDPHPFVRNLFAVCDDIGRLLGEIAAERCAFDPTFVEGERFAQLILLRDLRRFLAREISPLELCNLVGAIEGNYVDARPADDESVAYYPEWLGELWNACDWCDESWTHSSASHLVTEAQHVLQRLSAEDGDVG